LNFCNGQGLRPDVSVIMITAYGVFCDLPHVPSGAMGRFLLTQMAFVAELEAGLISERTKAALAAAKARGVKLGNPNGARALREKQVGNQEAVAAVRLKAQEHANNLRAIVEDIRAQGITSIRRMRRSLTTVPYSRLGAANGNRRPLCGARRLASAPLRSLRLLHAHSGLLQYKS
jgi:DNA invertase Pin-like site-specific DNA recombinase